MIQWLQPASRRACLFGALLAVLTGCNKDDNAALAPQDQGTFTASVPPVAVAPPVAPLAPEKLPETPVVGTVTVVPGTEPKTPVTTGGEATPLVDPTSQIVPLVQAKVERFTEIAPDTAGGATFRSSAAIEYNMGNLVAMTSTNSVAFKSSSPFITPIKGWARYPEKALNPVAKDRFPVIIFLHGQHTSSDPSYKGYDYLAERLAQHGYIVFSVDGGEINDGGGDGDSSSQSRGQLVLATLDVLRDIDDFGQAGSDGKPGALDPLKGKIDLSRIGIMGHSRGGQGIANAILFNKERRGATGADLKAILLANPSSFQAKFPNLAEAVIPAVVAAPAVDATETTPAKPAIDAEPASIDETKFRNALNEYDIFYASGNDNRMVPRYTFKGAFLLAATDNGGNTGLNNVPLAGLIPSCDGDVNDLATAATYDHNRFGPPDDQAPRYQILVQGANHNYYNSEWESDDFDSSDGAANCLQSNPDSIHLSRSDQERNGLFLINSFMRYHVGDEEKFAAYWNGTAQLPAAACPKDAKEPCDERVVLTVQKGPDHRKLIQGFDGDGLPDKTGKTNPDSMKVNALGGAVAFSGFDASARYAMVFGGGNALEESTPLRLQDFAYNYSNGQGFQSVAEHVELVWSKPAASNLQAARREVSISNDLMGLSATGTDSLTFRIAVVRPMGQEVLVTLTDGTGNAATITASDFSNALYNSPRPKKDGLPFVDNPADAPYADGQEKPMLNMVAIPLKAFEGVDTTNLKELKLVFPKESGKVAIADIELQNLGREKPERKLAARQ